MADKVVAIPGVGNVAFPDTMTDADISASAAKLYRDAQSKAPPTAPADTSLIGQIKQVPGAAADVARNLVTQPGATVSGFVHGMSDAAKQAVQATAPYAPVVGGLVGGLAGGPAGAGLGAAAGVGYKQLIANADQLPAVEADVARNLVTQPLATYGGYLQGATSGIQGGATEALKQAALQKAGDVAAGVVSDKLAPWVMKQAVAGAPKAVREDFPEVAQTLIDNGLTVSQGGLNKANALLDTATGKVRGLLQTAADAGQTVPVQLTQELGESFKTALLQDAIKARRIPVAPGQPVTLATARLNTALKAQFADIDRAVANGQPLQLDPFDANLLKQQLQDESQALYRNRLAINPKATKAEATLTGDYATQLNQAIDHIAPGYMDANQPVQALIGAVRHIEGSMGKSLTYGTLARPVIGAGLGAAAGQQRGLSPYATALAGGLLASPLGLSSEALLLASPAVRAAATQVPRIIGSLADYVRGQSSGQ